MTAHNCPYCECDALPGRTIDLARTPEPAPPLTGPGATADGLRRARELFEQTRAKEQAE